jgi:hypothetical protein
MENSDHIHSRHLSMGLSIGIIFLPVIFAWLVLRQGYSGRIRIIVFSWLIATIIFGAVLSMASLGNKMRSNFETINAIQPAAEINK